MLKSLGLQRMEHDWVTELTDFYMYRCEFAFSALEIVDLLKSIDFIFIIIKGNSESYFF